MQGMQGEQSGDKSALPDISGHAVEEPEEKQSTQDMQDKIGYMIPAGIKTIELIIEHQGEPGQRMPEFGVGCNKSPV